MSDRAKKCENGGVLFLDSNVDGAETFCIPEAEIRTSFNEDFNLRMREEKSEDDIVVLSLHCDMKRCVSV